MDLGTFAKSKSCQVTALLSQPIVPSISPFSLAFIKAKTRSGARTRYRTFDTSVVEVNKEDLTGFLEALQIG